MIYKYRVNHLQGNNLKIC